jgi:peptidoglycan/xylan/chitin deacetylase (PgdA/CDA1 family)
LATEQPAIASTIAEIIGKPLLVMRPPYGATSDYINHWINREFGMKVILWSVDPLDWKSWAWQRRVLRRRWPIC